MKLLVATGIFHPESGGPATYLHGILPQLQAHTMDVRLLTYGAGNDNTAYSYPVTRIARQALPVRLWQYAQAAAPMVAWADVIYTHTLGLPVRSQGKPQLAKIVGDQAWERSIRKGWIPPTTDIDDFQAQARLHPLALLNRTLRSAQARRFSHIIVPSHYLKQMVVGWGVAAEQVTVVYNALPDQAHLREVPVAVLRAALGIPAQQPTLLTVARLTPWKGVDWLIRAVRQVPDVHLLVAGEGSEHAALGQLAQAEHVSDRVHFLGKVAHGDVLRYMRAADYTALYSGYEGLSHTLIESLQVGTPLIASDKGGNPEVVQHNVNGLLVPYRNLAALVVALRAAFGDGTRATLAEGTRLGLEKFTYAQMVAQTVDVLRRFA